MSSTTIHRAGACCAAAFVALTALVWAHPHLSVDTIFDRYVLLVPDTMPWHAADAVSFIASGPVVAATALLLAALTALGRRRPIGAAAIVLAPVIAGGAETAMKSVVGRARPLTAALTGESGNGYPSGHVAGFTALAAAVLVVWMIARPTAIAIGGLAIAAVVWARVAVGAHYLTDTLGGALLGLAVGVLCAAACAALRVGVSERRLPKSPTTSPMITSRSTGDRRQPTDPTDSTPRVRAPERPLA